MKKLATTAVRGLAWVLMGLVPGTVVTGAHAVTQALGLSVPSLKALAGALYIGGILYGLIFFGVEVVEYWKKGEEE